MNAQTFSAKIKDGKIEFYDTTGSAIWMELLDKKDVEITIRKETSQRTNQQNRALHKFFELVSDELNEQGISITAVLKELKPGVDLFPTPEFIKELWRLFQKAQLKKSSTTQLDKDKDIDTVYELFCKFLGEKFGIYVEFPHNEPL